LTQTIDRLHRSHRLTLPRISFEPQAEPFAQRRVVGLRLLAGERDEMLVGTASDVAHVRLFVCGNCRVIKAVESRSYE
jgi:hypothetical protein